MIVGTRPEPAKALCLITLYPLESIACDDYHRQGGAKEMPRIFFIA
jgi:hypothetical protein